MKYGTDSECIWVFKDKPWHILTRGINPAYMILEKASPTYQRELQSKDINFQLSLTGIYRGKADERAISTLKNHFIA